MNEKLEEIRKELIERARDRRELQLAKASEHLKTIQEGYERYMDGTEDALKAVAALADGAEGKNAKSIPIIRTKWEFMKQMKPESVAAMMDGNYGDYYPWCALCDKSKADDCDGKCRETILKWLNKPLEVC